MLYLLSARKDMLYHALVNFINYFYYTLTGLFLIIHVCVCVLCQRFLEKKINKHPIYKFDYILAAAPMASWSFLFQGVGITVK